MRFWKCFFYLQSVFEVNMLFFEVVNILWQWVLGLGVRCVLGAAPGIGQREEISSGPGTLASPENQRGEQPQ